MSLILRSQIDDTITVCPYCLDEVRCDQLGCCGESSAHFAKAYLTETGAYLCDETEVVEDEPADTRGIIEIIADMKRLSDEILKRAGEL